MTSYVLTGDSAKKEKFVKDFIGSNNIPSYNLFDYQETLKIPQVREIKKLLSRIAMSGKKRAFVIRDATLEAQNALLKTLEELPEDTTFIFWDDTILIPTIISRARVLNFERKPVEIDVSLLNMVRKFIDDPSWEPLLFSDQLFSKDPNISFNNLIFALREILFEKLGENNLEKSKTVLKLLKSLYKYLPLVKANNLNERLLLERMLIAQISI